MSRLFCWVNHTLERVFPNSQPRKGSHLRLDLGLNDQGSCQACVFNRTSDQVKISVSVKTPVSGLQVRVRRVGYVPVRHLNTKCDQTEADGFGHIPGYVPDPLFDDLETLVGPREVQSYWISLTTLPEVPSGIHPVRLTIGTEGDEQYELEVMVCVHPILIPFRKDFPVTHWFCVDAICDYYGLTPFESRFWELVQPYMRNLLAHGTNVMHTPLFTPPTDGYKRPHQLLRIRVVEGNYQFDWRDVKRWVYLASQIGMEYFEWTHILSQWGVKYAINIYENHDGQYAHRLLWPYETLADSEEYRKFLGEFLPAFKCFLEQEGLLDKSIFHVSDEPQAKDLDSYRRARGILAELAPWMKVSDALSDISFAQTKATDLPIVNINKAVRFKEAGISRWDYHYCNPRGSYLNRLMDTPLVKIRASGWLFYCLGAQGFLHWGYNYWYQRGTTRLIDPYTVSDGLAWPNWAYGDPFVVYPGPQGPVDSLRWEVFSESLQDYAMLQALQIDPTENFLAPFRDYNDFPLDPSWYLVHRAALLQR